MEEHKIFAEGVIEKGGAKYLIIKIKEVAGKDYQLVGTGDESIGFVNRSTKGNWYISVKKSTAPKRNNVEAQAAAQNYIKSEDATVDPDDLPF